MQKVCLCPRLAAPEALSPRCQWYGGKGLWGRGCSGRQPCHTHFKILMFEDSKETAMLNPKGCLAFGVISGTMWEADFEGSQRGHPAPGALIWPQRRIWTGTKGLTL